MIECFRDKFIKNIEVVESQYFDEQIFLQGISLYEVFRVVDGKPLFIENHLKRLFNSAIIAEKQLWLTPAKIEESVYKLMQINNIGTGNVKIVFYFNNDEQTYLVYFNEHYYPTPKQYADGVAVGLYFGERTKPNAKIINKPLRDNVNKVKAERHLHEMLLVDSHGFITEGSRSNVFFIRGDKLYTSPVESVLPGVTRSCVIQICEKHRLKVIEQYVHNQNIALFDAVFLTSTSNRVLPVNRVENIHFNTKNDVIKLLIKELNSLEKCYLENKRVDG